MRSKEHKKVFRVLNYIEHLLMFASLVCIPIRITSYALRLTICVITAGIKKYKPLIKRTGKETW